MKSIIKYLIGIYKVWRVNRELKAKKGYYYERWKRNWELSQWWQNSNGKGVKKHG